MKTINFLASIMLGCTSLAFSQSKASIQKADSLFFLSDWKNAILAYEAALKTGTPTAVAFNRLGFAYHNLKQYEKALPNYEKALQNNPTQPLAATVEGRLARLYAVKNEKEKAIAHLQQAVELGYLNLQELETNADFASVRDDKRFAETLKIVKTNAFPCLSIPHAREFDFWVGEWDVYPNGAALLIGHSKVEVASGGCMVLENWTALGPVPNTGKSMNYVNSATGKWEQHWIGSGGLNLNNPQKFINGEYKDGAMRFEFETTTPQNQKLIGRFIFFNMGPDQVRQFNETSNDGGKTWTTVYDFIYKRRK
jgi:hypothetical protein